MNKVHLDAKELKKEILFILEKEKDIVLATSSNGRVTARSVSHVNRGLDILFQTGAELLKVEQIRTNPKVAICVGNLQIEGTAEILGHPFDFDNQSFRDLYQKKHPQSFEKYSSRKDETVILVKPSLFTFWKYLEGKPCRDYLDVFSETAWRVHYQ